MLLHVSMQEEREAALRREEEAFRARMMAQFAEADRIEQMNAQKRRMKQARVSAWVPRHHVCDFGLMAFLISLRNLLAANGA